MSPRLLLKLSFLIVFQGSLSGYEHYLPPPRQLLQEFNNAGVLADYGPRAFLRTRNSIVSSDHKYFYSL